MSGQPLIFLIFSNLEALDEQFSNKQRNGSEAHYDVLKEPE